MNKASSSYLTISILSLVVLLGTIEEVSAQYQKYIPAKLRNFTIKSQLYNDVIIYKYDDAPEYDYSNTYLELALNPATGDSAMFEKGEKILLKDGLRIVAVESRNLQDSDYVIVESHIGDSRLGFFNIYSKDESQYWNLNYSRWDLPLTLAIKIGNSEDSIWSNYIFQYMPDSTSFEKEVAKKKLPNDTVSNAYPFEIRLTDSTEWQLKVVFITKKMIDNKGGTYDEITEFAGEELKSVKHFKQTIEDGFESRLSYIVNPSYRQDKILERVYLRFDEKRKSKTIHASYAFSIWSITETVRYKNKEGKTTKKKRMSYGSKLFNLNGRDWKAGKPIHGVTRFTTLYSYDSKGRISRIDYKNPYEKNQMRYDIYTYNEN